MNYEFHNDLEMVLVDNLTLSYMTKDMSNEI